MSEATYVNLSSNEEKRPELIEFRKTLSLLGLYMRLLMQTNKIKYSAHYENMPIHIY